MKKVVFIADSAMDLPKELIEKHEIQVLPFHISFGNDTYRDGIDMTTEMLYQKVEELGILPKTAAIAPAEWKQVFDPIIEAGNDVFCLTIGSKISSSFQNAYVASLDYEEGRVEVVDSGVLSGAIAILMLKAVKFRDQGMSAKEIKNAVEKLVPKLHTQFVIPTLDYLYKGGRCSSLSKLIGSVLKIKPQIKMLEGKLGLYKKSAGKMSRAIDGMLDDFFEIYENGKLDPEFVFITHSIASKYAIYIREIVEERVKVEHLIESYAGSVISTHCGAGTIGILYLEK